MGRNLLLMAALFVPQLIWAQVTIKGYVVDKATKQPLVGVAIVEADKPTNGVATDQDGMFKLTVSDKSDKVSFSYLNYVDLSQSAATVAGLKMVQMEQDVIGLKDVVVSSSIVKARYTPIASSTIDFQEMEQQISTKDLPEILNATPGVYATKQGGGYGDSKINLRGFKSENVAVMVNGVPMNDMEWGGVYWSNWAGLSDVMRTMQVQRGLGAAKVSSPSVGGSINVITKTLDAQKGGSFAYGMGNDGYNKVTANFSTGLMDNGWAFSFLLGKTWGDGYRYCSKKCVNFFLTSVFISQS